MAIEIHHLVIPDDDPFILQQLFHQAASRKMMLTGKDPISVYDPVGGNIVQSVAIIHRPPYQTGAPSGSQIARYGPVRCYSPVRHLSHYLVDTLKKALAIILHRVRYKKFVSG